jgi:hypothetical protein
MIKCKLLLPAAKMADSLPLLTAAAIIVIKSAVDRDVDVVEGNGVANGC